VFTLAGNGSLQVTLNITTGNAIVGQNAGLVLEAVNNATGDIAARYRHYTADSNVTAWALI
jgi:hypothetical protein